MNRMFAGSMVATLLALTTGVAHAVPVTYEFRQNVNLLSSDAVTLSAKQQVNDVNLLKNLWFDTWWDGGINPAGVENWIAVDFGSARNIKTIRFRNFAGLGITNAVVETSDNGSSYTPRAAASHLSGTSSEYIDIVLDTAVDTRYLRVRATGTDFESSTQRWVVYGMRVFGDVGTLTDDTGAVNLVAGRGFAGDVVLSHSGVKLASQTDETYIDGTTVPILRQIMYNISAGDTITLEFDRSFDFTKFGMYVSVGADAGAAFTIATSPDGSTWNDVLTQSGIVVGMSTYTLAPSSGRFLRFTCTAMPAGNPYVTDLKAFGTQTTRSPTYEEVVFDNRANVNILNNNRARLTAGQELAAGVAVTRLRFSYLEGFWDGASNPPNGTNWIQVLFDGTYNMKTIRMLQYGGDYYVTDGIIETTTDGYTWTAQANSWTANGRTYDIVLASAVNSRGLRITPTAYINGAHRWIVYSLRIFGDAGTLSVGDSQVDLVSGTGFSGGVTMTLNGSISITDTTTSEYVNDALSPIKRQLLYNMGAGEGVTLAFDRQLTFNRFGFHFGGGTSYDAGAPTPSRSRMTTCHTQRF